ncbi:MAG: thiamine-phosphate kinase [Methanobrevibacter sp.]|jgi:thiamine-monophosphate kinase|nr:thiamine-phosphate kinase [Candidatus Methanovirga meridionalis]
MTNKDLIGDLGERKLIEMIIKKSESFQTKHFDKNSLKSHIGDDARVIAIGNKFLVLSTDMLIEKHHFPKKMTYYQRGFKAVTVNLSDIAAMGAYPAGILISLALPKNLPIKEYDNLLNGITEACQFYNSPLLGGDTNEGDELIISGTGIGISDDENVLMQYGFKNNDLIAISGEIGLSAIGFEILNQGLEKTKKLLMDNDINPEFVDISISKILSPTAKIKEGIMLKKSKTINSTTDITDGLSIELHQIQNSSTKYNTENPDNLGFIIHENKIPFINTIKKIAILLNKDYQDLIFNFGEDFELLFTIDSNKINEFKEYFKDKKYYIIGEVNQSNKIQVSLINGEIKEIGLKGYQHFNK